MLRMIAFDLDGTIADTLPLCIHAFQKGVSPFAGRALTREDITALFGLNEEGIIGKLAPARMQEALAGYYGTYEADHDLCPAPFDGVKELIAALRSRGMLVCMVTGKDAVSTGITLRRFKMDEMFDAVLTGSAKGNNKRERLLEIMDMYSLSPKDCLYVGDAAADVRAANAAGIVCLSAAWAKTADAAALEAINPGRVYTDFDACAAELMKLSL